MEARLSTMKGGIYGEEIAVRASKEEWRDVIDCLTSTYREPEGAPAQLIHWLINQGVYE